MKKVIVSLLLGVMFLSNVAKADCDWSQIKANTDGSYTYTKELNLCVGHLVQDNKTKDQQITDLNKAITLKDLAIKDADTRTANWMDVNTKLTERLNAVDSLEKRNDWLYFALGIIVTSAAVYGAGQLSHR